MWGLCQTFWRGGGRSGSSACSDVSFCALACGDPPPDTSDDACHQPADPEGQAWGYAGLSGKTLLLLRFLAGQCLAFTYLLKTDDDTFVHVPRLLRFVAGAPAVRCTQPTPCTVRLLGRRMGVLVSCRGGGQGAEVCEMLMLSCVVTEAPVLVCHQKTTSTTSKVFVVSQALHKYLNSFLPGVICRSC